MTLSNKEIDNKNMNTNDKIIKPNFAFVHIRPGLESKQHPVGTVAVDINAAREGELRVGYAVQHSKKDKWNSAAGRHISGERAARGRDTCLLSDVDPTFSRRQILAAAVALVANAVEHEHIVVSKKFSRALDDTFERLTAEKMES